MGKHTVIINTLIFPKWAIKTLKCYSILNSTSKNAYKTDFDEGSNNLYYTKKGSKRYCMFIIMKIYWET